MEKSVEQKLFEALQKSRGVQLSASDVADLLLCDDAVLTRISNKAALEEGLEPQGANLVSMASKTWLEFRKEIREQY